MSLIVSSHQPHYFPWLGYLDKMAKSDIFAINDIVQPTDKSPIVRNKILSLNGKEEYISISSVKQNRTMISIADYLIADYNLTKNRTLGRIKSFYFKAPYFKQIFPKIEEIFDREYSKVIDLDMATIIFLRDCFDIKTKLIFHSELNLDGLGNDKSENLLIKCKTLDADVYLSGSGFAKQYMNPEEFEANGIKVVFQDFLYPVYDQINSTNFVPNLSSLDILFNCGIGKSRDIFWKNVNSSKELKEYK